MYKEMDLNTVHLYLWLSLIYHVAGRKCLDSNPKTCFLPETLVKTVTSLSQTDKYMVLVSAMNSSEAQITYTCLLQQATERYSNYWREKLF